MPVLNIQGKRVNIGDDFLQLSPDEQNKTVEEIASQMNIEASPTDQNTQPQAQVNTPEQDQSILEELNRQQTATGDFQKNPVKYGKVVNGQPYDEMGIPLGGRVTMEDAQNTDPLKGVLDEEGDITTNAWDNMDYDQAIRAYNGLANHPETQRVKNMLGQEDLVFRGHKVPFPEPSLLGGASPSSVTLGGEGILNGISNIAQLGLSIIDSATGSNISPMAERPEMKSGSIGDTLTAEGPGMLVGGAMGLKGANTVISGVSKGIEAVPLAKKGVDILGKIPGGQVASTVTKGATRLAGAEMGTTAPLDEDTSGILVGDEALSKKLGAGSIEPFTVDEKASEGEQTLAKKLNLGIDSFISGTLLAGAGRLIGGAGKFAHNIYTRDLGPLASEAAQKKNINQDMLHSLGLPEGASPNERAAFAERINGYLEQGSQSFTQVGKDIDPLAAISEGAKANDDKLVGESASILRNDIYGANLPETSLKQKSYGEEVGKFKDDLYEAGGGEAGVETARKGILKTEASDRAALQAPVTQAQDALDTQTASLKQMIESDPQVGTLINDLSKNTNISIYKGVNQSEDSITRNAMNAEKAMVDRRNIAYSKLPSSVKVDNSFESLVKQVDEETGELEFRPFLNAKEQEIIEHANGSLKVLYKELVPQLSARITQLKNGGNPLLRDELINIRKNIVEEQVDSLSKRGAAASTMAKFDEIKNANKQYYRFLGKGSPLEGVRKANRNIIPGNVGTEEVATSDARRTVLGTLGNENREKTGALVELLSTPAGGQSQDKVVDLYIGRALQPLRAKIQKGDITDLEVEDFVKNLGKDAASLEKDFPSAYAKAEAFVNTLKSSKNVNQTLKDQLEVAQETFKTSDAALKKEMAPFYDNLGMEKTRGDTVFEDIFDTGSEGVGKVQKLIDRANKSGDPSVLKGIQGSFGQKLKSVGLAEFDRDSEKFMGVARELYKNDPQVLQGIEEAYRLQRVTEVGKGTRLGALTGAAAAETKANAAVNKVITLFFGVLNPTATRIRTIAGALAKENSPRDGMTKLIGEIASNPEQFKAMLTDFNKNNSLNEKNAKLLFEFGTRAGIFAGMADPERQFNDAWSSMQQEEMDDNAKTNGKRTEAQTEEALTQVADNRPFDVMSDETEEPKPKGKAVSEAPEGTSLGTLRPFTSEEYRQNGDGSYSTEVEVTVQGKDGKWRNVPSLWMSPAGWVQLNEDQASWAADKWEGRTKKKFPSFKNVGEAEKAASSRSHSGGVSNGSLAK